MKLNQKHDFVYWATQYIKRKCLGAKITEVAEEDGVRLQWASKGVEHDVYWDGPRISDAFTAGPEAIKALIQEEFKAAVEPAEKAV